MVNNYMRDNISIDMPINKLFTYCVASIDLTGPFYEENTGAMMKDFWDKDDLGLKDYNFDITVQLTKTTKGNFIIGEPSYEGEEPAKLDWYVHAFTIVERKHQFWNQIY